MNSSSGISLTVCMLLEGIPLVSFLQIKHMPVFTLCLSGFIGTAERPQDGEFIRQCLPRNIPVYLLPESPPHAEEPWLATRVRPTDPSSVPQQTICNTRLYIVLVFPLNCTKTNPRACKQSCMDVGTSYYVENQSCKCWRSLHSMQRQ